MEAKKVLWARNSALSWGSYSTGGNSQSGAELGKLGFGTHRSSLTLLVMFCHSAKNEDGF